MAFPPDSEYSPSSSPVEGEFSKIDRFLRQDNPSVSAPGKSANRDDGDVALEVLQGEFFRGRTEISPSSETAWVRFAHANDLGDQRTDRQADYRPNAKDVSKTVSIATKDRAIRWSLSAIGCALLIASFTLLKGSLSNTERGRGAHKEYVTAAGQQVTVTLDDGTMVTLAPDTRLRYNVDPVRTRRDVYLDGEAYFNVVSANAAPFTVFAGNTSTQVLGTAFGVRNYRGDSITQVYVKNGRVAFSGVGVLDAGDVASLTTSGSSTLRRAQSIEGFRSWMDGYLTVEGEPFRDVLPRLERWYGISIHVADPRINDVRLTAVFRGKSISNLVAVLGGALEARVSERDKTLTLSSW